MQIYRGTTVALWAVVGVVVFAGASWSAVAPLTALRDTSASATVHVLAQAPAPVPPIGQAATNQPSIPPPPAATPRHWSDYAATACAIIGVCLTGLGVWVAIQQARRARDSVRHGIFEQTGNIHRFLVDHPPIALIIYGTPVTADQRKDPTFMVQVDVAIEMLLDHYELVMHQSHALPEADRDSYVTFIQELHKNCPEMQRILKGSKFYSDELKKLICP